MKKKIILINVICISILIYSITQIYDKQIENKKAEEVYLQIRKINNESHTSRVYKSQNDEVKQSKHQKLLDINPDYRGWINISNTNIDYPIVQGKDNEMYLETDIYGQKLKAGSLFIDMNNQAFDDSNTIIYGHNMNNKTMFNHLEKFKIEAFFNENNKIDITTQEGTYSYEVFSVYVAAGTDDYRKIEFTDLAAYQKYLDEIVKKSLYPKEISLTDQDKILTLSTCSYEFEDARTVIHAKLINFKE